MGNVTPTPRGQGACSHSPGAEWARGPSGWRLVSPPHRHWSRMPWKAERRHLLQPVHVLPCGCTAASQITTDTGKTNLASVTQGKTGDRASRERQEGCHPQDKHKHHLTETQDCGRRAGGDGTGEGREVLFRYPPQRALGHCLVPSARIPAAPRTPQPARRTLISDRFYQCSSPSGSEDCCVPRVVTQRVPVPRSPVTAAAPHTHTHSKHQASVHQHRRVLQDRARLSGSALQLIVS